MAVSTVSTLKNELETPQPPSFVAVSTVSTVSIVLYKVA
ncbi:hypothetical protein BMETH_2954_0 [methanotrophic bacterial endosymbiont of Bathymodiolus sp.]|nr:hypothetical protein BMETH_2954_0 [methanotrophic bacterial endosymbiont of Bathymodiolus sp.]